MKRKLLLMLLCAALGLGAAQAEVYRVENEADVPADWAEKDTLRLTCIDTNRSDAMVLQSGGEAMMVDSGEGREVDCQASATPKKTSKGVRQPNLLRGL